MASFPTAAPTPEDVFAHAHGSLRVDLHARLCSCEVAVFEGRTGDPWCEEVLEVLDLMVARVRLSGHDSKGAHLCTRIDILLSIGGRPSRTLFASVWPSRTLVRFRLAYAMAAQQTATRAAHILRLRLSILEVQVGAAARSFVLAGDGDARSLSAALDLLAVLTPLRQAADESAMGLDRLEERLERIRHSSAVLEDPLLILG
ncbi:hypothetical protein BV20DRAFT_1058402 [Pilatotrama ljubarskyi]|nr:hypothetical protein BV20DRAFT_1058402 [Pilatotrama ljubarskyi]